MSAHDEIALTAISQKYLALSNGRLNTPEGMRARHIADDAQKMIDYRLTLAQFLKLWPEVELK